MYPLAPNNIYNLNCLEGLAQLKENSIDLIVSSPPYKDEDGFQELPLKLIFDNLYRVLKPNSLFFLNFGHLAEEKLRPFKVCELAMESGFKLNDTITWLKAQYSPIQGKRRLNNLTEFIFLLYKGKMPELNRLSIGVPYKDKSNIGRYSDVDLKCRGNLWEIPYETINKKSLKLHSDRFPVKLPEMCIKLAGIPKGALVLDCFSGSGSTALAAKRLGMKYLGFEINPAHWETSIKRLDAKNNNT